MRVAIVTENGMGNASTRYRALQHVERLARRFDIDVLMPAVIAQPRGGTADRLRFFGTHAVRYVHRAAELWQALRGVDAVLVQRGAYPLGPAAVVRTLDRFPGRVVLDLDDDVLAVSAALAAGGRGARWLYGPQQTLRLLRRADAVVVSTEVLAARLAPRRRADAILPTVPDVARHPIKAHAASQPVTIGWVGNAGNLVHLDPLRAVLGELRAEGIAELEVVSSASWDGPSRFRPWRLENEYASFLRFDIGIMPVLDSPYARSKAGFKLLQYLAAGLPVIASPVGVNTEIVTRSSAGALATSNADWARELTALSTDVDRRTRLGAAGRRWVEEYADLDHNADVLSVLLEG